MEWYLHNGALLTRDDWQTHINTIRERVHAAPPVPLDDLKHLWMRAFVRATLTRAKEAADAGQRIGVLLSGGIDSTLIAFVLHKNNIPFTCYTVGFKDPGTKAPEDVAEAQVTAQRYGWSHRIALLDADELEPVIKETTHILGDVANPVTVGVASVVVAGAQLARTDGCTTLFGGLGSEEIFAGYHRHGKAQRADGTAGLDEESWRGLRDPLYDRDLVRDCRIAAGLGISVPTPFLDEEVMLLAMQMPPECKLRGEHRKWVLREMAMEYGVPQDIALRPKRAAQYGSRVQKAISRLAKRDGTTEMQYIEGLADAQQK